MLALASYHQRTRRNYRVKSFLRRNHGGTSRTRRYYRCTCRRWRDLFSFFFSSLRGILTHLPLLSQRKFLNSRYPHSPLRDPIVVRDFRRRRRTCRCISHRNDPIENRHFYRRRLSQILGLSAEKSRPNGFGLNYGCTLSRLIVRKS